MATNTPKTYRNQIIYSVFVRNHTPEGTFQALRGDLQRIRELGTDIIWLMPIHPLGEKARKGSLGSPYAIRDYRAVNPEFGTMEDFRALVDDIHALGMKCIIDVVYNHTSPDSWLAQHHPEWFYHKPDGSFGNRIGDWSDIIDLDYANRDLWDYQIDTLKMWAGIVDGFRCDVAPLIPLAFWLQARQEVATVNPDCFWLSESVEPNFIVENRARGMVSLSDSEIFQAFDASYEYDVYHCWRDLLSGNSSLERYAEHINMQEAMYPDNYVKLRFLENHDNPRARFMVPDELALRNWTAFLYFQKGMVLLYGGQERMMAHLPSLFDRDTVDWQAGSDLSPLLRRLGEIKRHDLFTDSTYHLTALPHGVLFARHSKGDRSLVGLFCTEGKPALVCVDVPDGDYVNRIDGSAVEVRHGRISLAGEPVIFEVQ